tara:strand:+ start:1993 stop:2355 length:363 start_codon:yes stop_codon:yes gene_type:complete
MLKLSILTLSILLSIDQTVTVTCYQATVAQCDSDPFTTAFGYKIDPKDPMSHRYIAISRDLETYFSPGDSVIVTGAGVYDGMWMVADRMNRRWVNRIDLLVGYDSYVDKFTGVTIKKHVR